MNEKERALVKIALRLLQSRLEDNYDLHPFVQKEVGVNNNTELSQLISDLKAKL